MKRLKNEKKACREPNFNKLSGANTRRVLSWKPESIPGEFYRENRISLTVYVFVTEFTGNENGLVKKHRSY